MLNRRLAIGGALLGLGVAGFATFVPRHRLQVLAQIVLDPQPQRPGEEVRSFAKAEPWALKLIRAAESQIGVTLRYDPAYTNIAYPGDDVPRERGVCTDVIIRAYRDGLGVDLQELVHRDMRLAFNVYPSKWGLKRPDAKIDHRRVPNLRTFFKRNGISLAPRNDPRAYLPGDIVTQRLPGNLDHIGLVTDRGDETGQRPLIVHNIGAGARLGDVLFAFEITGQYRFRPATDG